MAPPFLHLTQNGSQNPQSFKFLLPDFSIQTLSKSKSNIQITYSNIFQTIPLSLKQDKKGEKTERTREAAKPYPRSRSTHYTAAGSRNQQVEEKTSSSDWGHAWTIAGGWPAHGSWVGCLLADRGWVAYLSLACGWRTVDRGRPG